MISEKTVELNITTELVNWNYYVSGTRPFILAPSQRQEGTLGFDTSIGYPGSHPLLIQYKRAYYKSTTNEFVYHLNRNTSQDQHLRLYILEMLGYDVWYALPLFYQPNEVINFRRRLLIRTLFLKPSWIIPISGMTGHHELRYNRSTKIITVHSDEGNRIENTFDFYDFAREIESKIFENYNTQEKLNNFLNDFNKVIVGLEDYEFREFRLEKITGEEEGLTDTMNVLVN